ncbi:MAG: bifunctional demethylmenaquinone methyltransferase/2-methoxy-6-polyprenyl-1,4-benzoquinol methylase UbiE [Candidatus Symbiodolus clandestinus]
MSKPTPPLTDFGFQTVTPEEKTARVTEIFSEVAHQYDLMNDLMSLGLHRLWKRFAVSCSGLSAGQRVLDLAGGTGDIARLLAPRVGQQGQVVVADLNAQMLKIGRQKLQNFGIIGNVDYVQADAEALPFTECYFDCVTIAFGLRNVTDKSAALSEMYRVLRPGGRLLVLEFSKPIYPWLQRLYDGYSFSALPRLGEWVANHRDGYRYLVESIRRHPDQQQLTGLLQHAGFSQVTPINLAGGIVALHRGFRC